jgi:putative phage-type endonuclease
MMEQQTKEWFDARRGHCTGSRIAEVIAKTKSGYAASRENYLTEIVLQKFGIDPDRYSNEAMEWGNTQEPFARMEYESRTGNMVLEVGYCHHPSIKNSGASPDGVIGQGVLEIKCPNTKTHFEYLLAQKVPEKYKPQMSWEMACTGAEWCDFVSFDPRAPEGLQYFQIRYERDNDYIAFLEDEVSKFLIEVDAKFEQLKAKLEELKA